MKHRMKQVVAMVVMAILSAPGWAEQEGLELPVQVGPFDQQQHLAYTVVEGLPANDVLEIERDEDGIIHARTSAGIVRRNEAHWEQVADGVDVQLFQGPAWYPSLSEYVGSPDRVRDVAEYKGEVAVAAESGLYIGDGKRWQLALPQQGAVRWAPVDVRAVAYDAEGRLWFASPQGVGRRDVADAWSLFTGQEGLPYNDFTCMAAGPKGVWFGTSNGAIRFADGQFEYRQGRRWLLDNHVHDIAVDANGDAWFATSAGVSCISFKPITLAEKAAYFESEIDRYHRRTRFGFVNPAVMAAPGDKSTAEPEATDNDGHFMGLYLGAMSLAYATTHSDKHRADAENAFKALSFLSEVTEGGTHPAPRGFIARAVRPTDGPDPNEENNAARDRIRKEKQDALWKIMDPRWPVDATGEWYWKCDSSSDELDGYYFGFGIYYDHVCETDAQREAVRDAVRRMTDHLIDHGFNLVDHDGQPTRWGHLSPADLNHNKAFWVERGLNSLSMLTYLSVTHHITGDPKYREAYLKLALEENYAFNGMTQPKVNLGPGSFGQADDNMAFMHYYPLIRYETDPGLLSMYHNAIYYHWNTEKYERNPFFNFVYAACCLGRTRVDQWGVTDLSPPPLWIADSVDTLKRYPLDLVDWPMSNAHRIDMLPLPDHTRGPGGAHLGKGCAVDGKTYRIDEQHAIYWGDDPWHLTNDADGTRLREGVSFLLAYYQGLVHGYITG